MNYTLYLFSCLLKLHDKDFNNLPYDEQFDLLPNMLLHFENSNYASNVNKSEYDCIEDYLKNRYINNVIDKIDSKVQSLLDDEKDLIRKAISENLNDPLESSYIIGELILGCNGQSIYEML